MNKINKYIKNIKKKKRYLKSQYGVVLEESASGLTEGVKDGRRLETGLAYQYARDGF